MGCESMDCVHVARNRVQQAVFVSYTRILQTSGYFIQCLLQNIALKSMFVHQMQYFVSAFQWLKLYDSRSFQASLHDVRPMSLHLNESNLCDSCYTDEVGCFIPSLVLPPRDTLTKYRPTQLSYLMSCLFTAFRCVVRLCMKCMELMHNKEVMSFVDKFQLQNHLADFYHILNQRFRFKIFRLISFLSILLH